MQSHFCLIPYAERPWRVSVVERQVCSKKKGFAKRGRTLRCVFASDNLTLNILCRACSRPAGRRHNILRPRIHFENMQSSIIYA
jgi:hypothetical protein